MLPLTSPSLPKHIWTLLAVYFLASLAHFAHNAEYIAYYPNMPAWLTRDKVYLAWLVVTSIGVAGLIVLRLKMHALSSVLIAVYGALGLDGLAHYALALCSQHTIITNITIWSEASAGFALLVAAALVSRGRRSRRQCCECQASAEELTKQSKESADVRIRCHEHLHE